MLVVQYSQNLKILLSVCKQPKTSSFTNTLNQHLADGLRRFVFLEIYNFVQLLVVIRRIISQNYRQRSCLYNKGYSFFT